MTTMLDEDQSRSSLVFVVTLIFLVLATIAVVLRLISRAFITRRVDSSDYSMILAWLLAFGLSVSIIVGTTVGLGDHDIRIHDEWWGPLKKSEYAFSVLYNPALMATKTSILIFYLSLSENNKMFRWSSIATLVVVNATGFALTILNITQCQPISDTFLQPLPEAAQCRDILSLYLSSTPVNIATDLAILFLPIPILTAMRLPKKQKRILVLVFLLGGFVTIVDVIRIAYLQQAAANRFAAIGGAKTLSDAQLKIAERVDFAWYASLSFMWSSIEVNVGIICACIPTLRPLVARLTPRLIRDTSSPQSSRPSPKVAQGDGWGQALYGPEEKSGIDNAPPAVPAASRSHGPLHSGIKGSQSPDDQDDEVDFMDFLSGPVSPSTKYARDSAYSENRLRAIASPTGTRAQRSGSTAGFYDFVNKPDKKSAVRMNNRESYYPLALVTVLFFMWGFAYGLLSTLNDQFTALDQTSTGQNVGLHSAYFGAYFIGPLTIGQYVLRKGGFKMTFIVGLCIYGLGTLVFWPSAVLLSYPAFLVSNFIVGLGLSVLETAANPFIAICGPPEYAEIRLGIAQGIQAVGSVVSPILARRVLFNSLDNDVLARTQYAYLAIALFDVLLAVAFHYSPLPEASNDDFEQLASHRSTINQKQIGTMTVPLITLALGAASQWFYVGGQEILGASFESFVQRRQPGTSLETAINYHSIGYACFAASRFLGAGLMFYIKPRVVLLICYVGCIITGALSMTLQGGAATALVILSEFFEGPIWYIIFAQCLRGMGKHTKSASAFLTMGASGGAVWPAVAFAVQQMRSLQYSFCVSVAVWSFGLVFPVYLMFTPAAKRQVDPVVREERDGRKARLFEKPLSRVGRLPSVVTASSMKRRSTRISETSDERINGHEAKDTSATRA